MKGIKNSLFYIIIIGGFIGLTYWVILNGKQLETGRNVLHITPSSSQWKTFLETLRHNLGHPLAILLAQILTIILAARLMGWVCKKIGQPTVIGEIIAGIALGPSLFGAYFPEFSLALFPKESLPNIQFLSQIGLILFMFVVGMELDLKVLKNKAHDAVVISHASIIFPFALGVGLAYFIYNSFAPTGVQFSSFALFLGIAMSITAFPVLARIVQERNLHKTRIGAVVITCAAADDITAWCILAAVIAIVKAGTFTSALYIIALAALYVIAMIGVVRPFLSRIGNLYQTKEQLNKPIVAIFFITLILSAYCTEVIGIHALFGAFMAGAIMPENTKFRTIFIEKVEDLSLILLLPLFFVFTGLRTEIGLLNEPHLWYITGMIVAVAVIGKFLGSAIAARFVGQHWKDSLIIGALMNTRGLMELVVLNIGYDLGVLTPEIFSMMVIMALVTTFMTGPLLDFIEWLFKKEHDSKESEQELIGSYRILVSFDTGENGRSLLRLANSFVRKQVGTTSVTTMHLAPTNELHTYDLEDNEKEMFLPVIEESKELNQPITTLFKASNDIESEISETANKGEYDLLLVGLKRSIFEGSALGRILGFTTRFINPEKLLNRVSGKETLFNQTVFDDSTQILLNKSKVPVGVFIEKNFTDVQRICIPMSSVDYDLLMTFAKKQIVNSDAQVSILDIKEEINTLPKLRESIRAIEQIAPNHIQVISQHNINTALISKQDLTILSIENWKWLLENKEEWISGMGSTLILKGENN
jgi:Kef-type K+ transport system membrane component KefB